jgi:hypothetical protein
MARFNEILSGRYNRFLQRLFSIKGGPPSPQLASEIMASFDVHRLPVEYRFLMQERLYGSGQTVLASVGNLSALRLRNPASSNVLITIEKILVAASVAVTITVNRQSGVADFVTPFSGAFRDLRGSTAAGSGSVGVISAGNPVATAGAQLALIAQLANVAWDFIVDADQEIVVAPNDSVTVYDIVANSTLDCTFFWRERPMEEGEVSG